METKIKEILAKNNDCVEIRELGLCFGIDEVIDYLELNHEDEVEACNGGIILFYTEYGDRGSFDMLAKYQQDAIYEFVTENF